MPGIDARASVERHRPKMPTENGHAALDSLCGGDFVNSSVGPRN